MPVSSLPVLTYVPDMLCSSLLVLTYVLLLGSSRNHVYDVTSLMDEQMLCMAPTMLD